MKKLTTHFANFWFSPMPAERLALLRIASGAFTLWYLVSRLDLLRNTATSDIDNFAPVGLAAWLSAPLDPAQFMWTVWLTIGLGFAYMLGWKFKYSGPAFALLSLFVFSYRYSWSMIYHDNIAVVLHVLVIALSPAADAYSLDASKNRPREWHWQYGWPVRLLCVATALTYFVSGLAKVFSELAWQWVNGTAMRSQVAVDAMRKDVFGEAGSSFFTWLYAHSELFLLMGVFTMIIELGAPLALATRKTRVSWAILTWGMHFGIFFLMGITFRYQMSGLIFLPFFAVEKIGPWIWGNVKRVFNSKTQIPERQQETAIVLFDGVCNFCNKSVRFIAERDPKGYFQFVSQQSDTGRILLDQHQAPTDLSSMVLIEKGHVYLHSTAVLRITKKLNGIWPLLYSLIIVPSPIRNWFYHFFARNRYKWFGKTEQCPLPSPEIRGRFLTG